MISRKNLVFIESLLFLIFFGYTFSLFGFYEAHLISKSVHTQRGWIGLFIYDAFVVFFTMGLYFIIRNYRRREYGRDKDE